MRGACARARRREDCGGQIHVDAQRGGLRHDVSDLTLEAIEESCAFGEDCVLIGLRELSGKLEELLARNVRLSRYL